MHQADVLILGGGLAGMVTALELLGAGKKCLLVDRDRPERMGGLAKESFGGVTMIRTREQERGGIRDSEELLLRDWLSVAELDPEDHWPKKWAERYASTCHDDLYLYLKALGVKFFPVVHWVERGLYRPGNSVPRFHMVWGTGKGLTDAIARAISQHPKRANLAFLWRHRVETIEREGGVVRGCAGIDEETGRPFAARADAVVLATGGICGSIELVKRNWFPAWGAPPATLLNGSHRYANGLGLEAGRKAGAKITHLNHQWNYAAGVHHPRPDRPNHGLSIVPPKSALWMDAFGRRIGPVPLVTAYDTRFLVESICRTERKYSWQILNRKIALKELAVSGSEYNDAIRDKKLLGFLFTVLFGNRKLVDDLSANCRDFAVATNVDDLASKMNAIQGDRAVDPSVLREEIGRYDAMIDRGETFMNDDQLRRIAQARMYRGDRVRTCKFQKILDPRAGPLIAIREFILSRKTLGGIQTDLDSRALDEGGAAIPGLFAVGEAAGFGGGGIHGVGSLEGTFLGSCVLTARAAARALRG